MLVGRSHECDYPPQTADVPVLTSQATQGTDPADIDRQVRDQLATGASLYSLNAQLLRDLRPDVILTQDLCSVCSIDLSAVRAMTRDWGNPPRIVSLNPASFEDVLDSILTVGEAVGLAEAATSLMVSFRERIFAATEFVNPYDDGPSVAFLEWTDPLFVGGHWIPQMIERAGGLHLLNPTVPLPGSGSAAGPQQAARKAGKSNKVAPEVLSALNPDALIVCPCGVDLAGALRMTEQLALNPWFRSLKAVRSGRVAVVDGNQMFSRPGPRLVDAQEWLVAWLHNRPEVSPQGFPWMAWHAPQA